MCGFSKRGDFLIWIADLLPVVPIHMPSYHTAIIIPLETVVAEALLTRFWLIFKDSRYNLDLIPALLVR